MWREGSSGSGSASNRALHQSETVRQSALPDLKPNSKTVVALRGLRLILLPCVPRNRMPRNPQIVQVLPSFPCHSDRGRSSLAWGVSVNPRCWQGACNPVAHGSRHGIRRTPQFEERFHSLARRHFFRHVSPGLWRRRWSGFATAPSFRSNRHRFSALSLGAARRAASIYGDREQFDGHSRELERERNLRRQSNGGNDQQERLVHLAGRPTRDGFGHCAGQQRRGQLQERNRFGFRKE
jgi:hypothetical protein